MAAKMKIQDSGSTNDFIEDICKESRQLKYEISRITEKCKQRRDTVEKHCSQCRELFNPWPSNLVNEMGSCDNQIAKNDDGVPSPFTDDDNVKEKEELAMLDDILAKAQHARDIQQKMTKPNKKSHSTSKISNVPTSRTMETKPKITYPIVKKPQSARSTYSASYTKPARAKTLGSGTKRSLNINKDVFASRRPEKVQTTKLEPPETKKTKERLGEIGPSGLTEDTSSRKTQQMDINKTALVDDKFLISEKGGTLTMPIEFKKTCKEHKAFLRRIRKALTLSQTESEREFIGKTEKLFHPVLNNLQSFFELGEEMLRVEEEYNGLLSEIKLIALRMHCASESSGSLEAWRATDLKFKQLNHDVEIIKKNLDYLSTYCPLPDHNVASFGEHEIVNGKLNFKNDFSKTDVDGCFSYQDIQELRTLIKLSYDAKIMASQIQLRREIAETMLPLLRECPTSNKSFVSLFRTIYSILCCESKTFPAVVKDSLPEPEAED
ncbi:uncharacterized protein LOC114527169 [Dendronephthya gigantea]|uniref:uncharacterized protein LOC114527169 n=1 Tax=Dendronephthya gigantea TaxID=151771 RepID=UPI00106AA0F7|nr:uncharacterized protein LOC114527169 [Dendronephthya gigantea]